MILKEKIQKRDLLLIAITIVLITLILFIPTTGENDVYKDSYRARGLVLETDNSGVSQYGIVKQGDQEALVRILNGPFKGREAVAGNMLYGKLELDKMFVPGDVAFIVIDGDHDTGEVRYVNLIDHYRINIELILFVLFMLLLLLFAGWTGAKAFLSFIFSGLLIWKVLVPGLIKGFDPLLLSLALVTVLTAVIIFLIGGLNRKGAAAFLGAMSGVAATTFFSFLFGNLFRIHGAVKPFSETLLYSGYAHLDLTRIFLSSIFIASSGAVMDLAMDIASAQYEIREKKPDIHHIELIKSGFSVGRAVVGTMTTTLLLAYSGGYMTLLMVFIAQGIPLLNVLNLSYVSAEILHTLVGSFGLVLVAPFTAIIGGSMLTPNRGKQRDQLKVVLQE